MQPKHSLSLCSSIVEDLFPFHLLFNDDGILSIGTALTCLLPKNHGNSSFGDLFTISRPEIDSISVDSLKTHAHSSVILKIADTDVTLRGQFVAPTDETILFVGSILIKNADSLNHLGINLNSFAPFDVTPDMVIMRKFRELETKDLEKKSEILADLSKSRDELSEHANTDELTKITNRRGFWSAGIKIMQEHNQQGSSRLMLGLLDLDEFKLTNDRHGHDAGDAVLCEVANRLNKVVGNRGLVGRLGGDEFVLILILDQHHRMQYRAERVLAELNQPFQYGHHRLSIKASMGATEILPGDSLDTSIHNADIAMYEGRKNTRGTVYWYSTEIEKQVKDKDQMLSSLRKAINNGLIEPHFQPIISLADNCLCSFEALARWNDPVIGMVRPDIFIELTQELGMLDILDRQIMEKSLDQLTLWHSQGKMYSMHVNVSAASLNNKLVDRILNTLEQRNLDPCYLWLELTETAILENTEFTRALFGRLRNKGLKLTLDDFGTGYSSLTHIKDFPVSGIKIDQSYVADVHVNDKTTALLRSIANIAKDLDLSIIAEGIETQEQLDFLQSIGCHFGQGYYIGRPATHDTCENLFPQQHDKAA